ncbi:MAG TPA: aldehyde dehydrogenase family protein [Actinomycetota bacterium]
MIEVRNPRSGRIDHRFEPRTPEQIAGTAATMRIAQHAWEEAGVDERALAMLAWAEALRARRGDIVDALIADTGRRIESELEVDAVLGSIARWCAQAPALLEDPEPRPASIPFVSVRQGLRPYPLVGVISPWNFPLLLSVIDAIPALLAGCAVLVKPSEIAPRFIDAVGASIDGVDELRPVFGYIAGDGSTGEALIDVADCVCFTGSVATGRRVAAHAARLFIPAFLELGGKDPAIVLASADLDRASSAILWGATANAGQSCLSIERVYVEQPVFEPFVEQLVAKAQQVRLAAPVIDAGELGPIIAERQIAIIAEHLDDALAKGAKARTGGSLERIGGGTYLRPTVLTDVDHSMKVMVEETFGPIIPVMAVADEEEAIALANDTAYGLSAAVFAGDTDEAIAVGRRIEAGGISINDAALTALVYDGEKNSFRSSGLGGSRMGPVALRRFGRRQAFLIAAGDQPDPWWFPHLRAP